MFGGKNARRVSPKRVPSRQHKTGCFRSIGNCCVSCGAHGWFLTLFCGYILVSSLPRILIILDFLITLSLYLSLNSSSGSLIDNYSFRDSTIDIVILSFIRCIILFICFAFRYQREGYRNNLYFAFTTVLLTSSYLIIKLFYEINIILLFSFSFVWVECIFFFMVRRRRIRYAPSISSISSLKNKYYSFEQDNKRKIMEPQQQYYQIKDCSQLPKDNILIKPQTPPQQASRSSESSDKLLLSPQSISPHPAAAAATATNTTIIHNFYDKKGEKDVVNKNQNEIINDNDCKTSKQFLYNNNNNISDSINALIPDNEFTVFELPLKTINSEFIIIDGVTVHYAFEANLKYKDNDNINIPYIVLLHGFGGGIFSFKRCWSRLLNDIKCKGILAFDRVGFGLTQRPLINTCVDIDNNNNNNNNNNNDDNNPYSVNFSLKIVQILFKKFNINQCIFIAHSTGALIANWFTYYYPSYVIGLILISATSGMPAFIRSILKTSLGKPIILSLIRSEIGQVTLHRAWHSPKLIDSQIITEYRNVLKLKNWNESLLEMSLIKSYSSSNKYHQILSTIKCPIWFLHGDDDKLVNYRESVRLSQYYSPKYYQNIIKLKNCGHIPHQEIPNIFINQIELICQNLNINKYKQSNIINNNNNNQSKIKNKFKKIIMDIKNNINIINIKNKNNQNNNNNNDINDENDENDDNVNIDMNTTTTTNNNNNNNENENEHTALLTD